MLTRRARLVVLGVCVVVGLVTAWYSGTQSASPAVQPSAGTVRLGPEPGELVADYLARLPAELPASGVETLALVQFAQERSPDEALAAVGTAAVVTAVFHVPLPRVQTALRFAAVQPGSPVMALAAARDRAQFAAAEDAARRTERPAAVAAAEAGALTDPRCRCLLALVVRADRAGLDHLAARPGIRAVQAAPAGAAPIELALAPLLPGQADRADPLPDDGPVPPA